MGLCSGWQEPNLMVLSAGADCAGIPVGKRECHVGCMVALAQVLAQHSTGLQPEMKCSSDEVSSPWPMLQDILEVGMFFEKSDCLVKVVCLWSCVMECSCIFHWIVCKVQAFWIFVVGWWRRLCEDSWWGAVKDELTLAKRRGDSNGKVLWLSKGGKQHIFTIRPFPTFCTLLLNHDVCDCGTPSAFLQGMR